MTATTTQLLQKALHDAFLAADSSVRENQKQRVNKEEDRSGCTAVCAFITPTHLVMAHAGDSRAVLASAGTVS